MSNENNKALARRVFEEIWNQHNLAAAETIYSADLTNHNAAPWQAPGREGEIQFAGILQTAFPDVHISVEDALSEADRVVIRYSATGTHLGPLGPIPPTGRTAAVTGTASFRIESDRIKEIWLNWDELGLLRQLGVIPDAFS
jgi:steroid delta-isomerase-like uncharacterized protein